MELNGSSPGSVFWRKLKYNTPALAGAFTIVVAVLIVAGGYFILPDSTPYANSTLPVIQKMPPGYQITYIKVTKPEMATETSWWQHWLYGEEDTYQTIPIKQIAVNGAIAEYIPVRRIETDKNIVVQLPINKLQPKQKYYSENQQLGNLPAEAYVHNRTFWLGTDRAGRDVLSRLLLGARVSLAVGFMAVLLSVTVGVVAGAVAGYAGGFTDKVLLWFMTVIWSVPGIILVIAISLALQQKGMTVMFLAIGLTSWVEVARLVRGEMIMLKQKTFVEAAIALGLPDYAILIRHMLPNLVAPIIVVATANFAAAILMEAGLSFLGLGVQPPVPSWGMMVNEGFQMLGSSASWYMVLWPSVSICILVLAFNLLGNGLRDALDPKTFSKK